MGKPFNIVTRQTGSTQQSYEDYGTEVYYPTLVFNPMPAVKWFCSVVFWIVLAVIVINIISYGIIFIISFYKPKVFNCPKCKRIFRYREKRPKNCPLCGVDIDEFIKPR